MLNLRMRKRYPSPFGAVAALLVISAFPIRAYTQTLAVPHSEAANNPPAKMSAEIEQATFGGGCFWCTEAVFERFRGVYSVVSGYSGGGVPNPTYQQVSTGLTGHAEVIQITYNTRLLSYTDLLEVFFATHDPTTLNQQGVDVGTQYRSVIFYHNPQQRQLATEYRKKLNDSGEFDRPIVTEISPFQVFYPAEAYHQGYYDNNSRQPYCRAVIRPKMTKLQKVFEGKLKGGRVTEKVRKTNAQWRDQLTAEQYAVTRKKHTERPFTGKLLNNKGTGTYKCVACGLPLYDSETKYDSGCGWPSFWAPVNETHLLTAVDRSLSMVRTELTCARCGAHLGHIFNDGPTPTGLRHCINSAALQFEPAEDKASGESSNQDKPASGDRSLPLHKNP